MQNSFVPQFMLDDEKDRMETRIKQAKSNIAYTMSPIKNSSSNKKKKLRLRNNIPMSTIIDENIQSSVFAGPSDM